MNSKLIKNFVEPNEVSDLHLSMGQALVLLLSLVDDKIRLNTGKTDLHDSKWSAIRNDLRVYTKVVSNLEVVELIVSDNNEP